MLTARYDLNLEILVYFSLFLVMSISNCTKIIGKSHRDRFVTISPYLDRIANLNAVTFDTPAHINIMYAIIY